MSGVDQYPQYVTSEGLPPLPFLEGGAVTS